MKKIHSTIAIVILLAAGCWFGFRAASDVALKDESKKILNATEGGENREAGCSRADESAASFWDA